MEYVKELNEFNVTISKMVESPEANHYVDQMYKHALALLTYAEKEICACKETIEILEDDELMVKIKKALNNGNKTISLTEMKKRLSVL